MSFTIGTLSNVEGIQSYSGFDLPRDLTVVDILSDGSALYNSVAQSSGSGFPVATLSGITTSSSVISALRAYRLSHESLTFADDQAVSHTVIISEFGATQSKLSDIWDWSATLLEIAAYVAPE